MFAATPPLFILKALLSSAATDLHKSGKPLKILFIDIRRAFSWAKATDWIFIELAQEERTPGKDEVGGMEPGVGRSMYGTRSGAKNWQAAIT